MKAIKIKTSGGKAVHVGARYGYDTTIDTLCPKARNSTLVEVSADAEVTCKYCLSANPAQETISDPIASVEPLLTIRISADMETILNSGAPSNSLKKARDAGVSWKAGKLYVTRAGRDALLWYLEMRATVAQEALTDGRPVYPARRALWHAAVKLSRQASYILAA